MFVLVLIFFCEVLSFLFLKYNENPYLKAKRLLVYDDAFHWRQRINSDKSFYDYMFNTNEAGFRSFYKLDEKVEAILLGPSSSVGWGVGYENMFSTIIEKKTGMKFLNASQIGYTIEQGYKLYVKTGLKDKKIRYLIVSFGVNELDYFPFQIPKSSQRSLYHYSSLYFLIENTINNFNQLYPCPETISIRNTRLSFQSYLNYLSSLKSLAQKQGAILIVLNTGHLYSKYRSKENIHKSKSFYEKMNQEIKSNNCYMARKYLQQAQLYEPYRINNELNEFNLKLKNALKEMKIKMIDIHSDLVKSQKNFIDPVHFSINGNKVVADKVLNFLKTDIDSRKYDSTIDENYKNSNDEKYKPSNK